jgi:diaminopimelate epimerase
MSSWDSAVGEKALPPDLPGAPVAFAKMSGAGNDFILIDNRGGAIGEAAELARRICRRRLSLGADGLILIEKSPRADFGWRFYNNDGSLPEMCGNGARCAARFAHLNGIAGREMRFETLAGLISAEIRDDQVAVRMTPPGPLATGLELELAAGSVTVDKIDTGVPHAVLFVEDVAAVDVVGLGREIRFHPRFAPAGANVNFAAVKKPGLLALRTYERGVEDETLACGTGATAAALGAARRFGWPSPIHIDAAGGSRLSIAFVVDGDGFRAPWLQGDARLVCSGTLASDAWNY